jgi:hypothetical protein
MLWKTSLYFRDKDGTIKDFKIEILICFNSLITKHWPPLHQTSHIFPHSFTKLSHCCTVGSTRWLQMFFKLQKEMSNVWGLNLHRVPKCFLANLSLLFISRYSPNTGSNQRWLKIRNVLWHWPQENRGCVTLWPCHLHFKSIVRQKKNYGNSNTMQNYSLQKILWKKPKSFKTL